MPYAYCRSKPIKSIQYLGHQSRHARRVDETSKPRMRPGAQAGACLSWAIDAGPEPDYAASFRALKKAMGAGERKGAQIGLHMLVGVSPSWVEAAGALHDPKNPRNRQLLEAARAWADSWSGGGCYAARLDLDETGGAVVDLFIAPLAEQKHKSGRSKLTVSVNKALEAISLQHTGKKSKHYAGLNSSWADYARQHLDPQLQRGRPKSETGVEHLGPDAYRAMMVDAEAARTVAHEAEARAKAMEKEARAKLAAAEERLKQATRAVETSVRAAAAVLAGTLLRSDQGKWTVKPGSDLRTDDLKPIWSALRPALDRVADWWNRVVHKVDALPEPARREFLASVSAQMPDLTAAQAAAEPDRPGF